MTFLVFSMQAKIARSSRFPVTSSAEGANKIIDQRQHAVEMSENEITASRTSTIQLFSTKLCVPYPTFHPDLTSEVRFYASLHRIASHRIQSNGKRMTALFRTPIITTGLLFLGAFTVSSVSGLELSVDRRSFITSAFATCAVPTIAHAAGPCASGVGDGCADLAEGNSLIRELQERSAANKERNEKVRTSTRTTIVIHSDDEIRRRDENIVSHKWTTLFLSFRKHAMPIT